LDERNVVFVCADEEVGILLRSFFDQLKEGALLLLPINDKCSVEYLMAAVLGIHLREAEYFAIGKFAAKSRSDVLKILNLFFTEGKAFFLVVRRNVVDLDNWIWLVMDREQLLVEAVVQHFQHTIVVNVGAWYLP